MKHFFTILIILQGLTLSSQEISSEEKRKYTLEKTIEVEVLSKSDCQQCYYYLPTNLSVSISNNAPEISLIKWDAEGGTEAGGILHFLVSWKLSKAHQLEIQNKISSAEKEEAVIMGPVSVESKATDKFFYGDHELVEILNTSLQNKPAIATTPGAKMAFSFRFSEEELEALDDYLNDLSGQDAKLKLYYSYRAGTHIQQIELVEPLKNILVYLK